MDESFSPTIFLYGMALVFAVGKGFTLTIWRTLPKPRPGLRHEMRQAWKDCRLRKQAAARRVQRPRSKQTADDPLRQAVGEPPATRPAPEQGSPTHPGSTQLLKTSFGGDW